MAELENRDRVVVVASNTEREVAIGAALREGGLEPLPRTSGIREACAAVIFSAAGISEHMATTAALVKQTTGLCPLIVADVPPEAIAPILAAGADEVVVTGASGAELTQRTINAI